MNGNTPEAGPDGMPVPKAGNVIGSYRLIRLLGEGSSGRVFEVEHLKIGRRAAMKILAPTHAAQPGAIKRLFREARAVNQINHPHIVEVTDLLEAEQPGQVNAIVMELLEGQSLQQLMHAKGPLAPARYLPIISQVADALLAAHRAQFVHRDLKPDNIFLIARGSRSDYVKVLDFGLAKSFNDGAQRVGSGQALPDPDQRGGPGTPVRVPGSTSPPPVKVHESRPGMRTVVHGTSDGTFVGTAAYASPEQAGGRALDHRTDIYSLGVILYELLCGRLPFEGKNLGDFLIKHITEAPPPPPPELLTDPAKAALWDITARCLAKVPAQRWASAADLKRAIEAIAGGGTPEITPAQNRWAKIALTGTVLLAAIVGAATLARHETPVHALPPPDPTVPAPAAAPSASKTIIITFTSDPAGAEIRRAGDGTLLGLTPFHRSFVKDGSEIEFEMRAPGFRPGAYLMSMNADATLEGHLVREPDAAKKVSHRPPKASHARPDKPTRGFTINPFVK